MDGVNQAANRYSMSPVIETRVPQDNASRFAAAAPLPNPRTSYDISRWGSIKTMVSRKIEILFAGTERATVKDRHAHKDVQMDLVRVMVRIGQGKSPTRALEALMVSLDNFEKRGGGNAMEAIEQALYRMDVEIKDAPDRFEKNLKFLDRVSSDKIRQGGNQIFEEGRSAGHDMTASSRPENKMQLLLQQIGQSAR
ncbi:MAG: hypothetical protein JWQ23_1668, partial [Herminiimonas sp.]|nr:hypothetical protein [Herminiimonas sp.]